MAALGMNHCGQHWPAQCWEGVGRGQAQLDFISLFVATWESTLLEVCVGKVT